jgi:hypothetical protein
MCILEGTVPIPTQGTEAIKTALADASPEVNFNGSECFAPIDIRTDGEWSLLTLVGLVNAQDDLQWKVSSNGVWSDLAIIHFSDTSITAAIAGTKYFSELLALVPESIFSPEAKKALDPRMDRKTSMNAFEGYIFPFESGREVNYFRFHWNTLENFTFWTGANSKAVDIGSDGNTGINHAPNRLLAVAPGWVRHRCSQEGSYSSTYLAVENSDGVKIIYAHLDKSSAPLSGTYISQGQFLGTLKAGNFSEGVCGSASQNAGSFHVHFEVPNTASLTLSDWTLNTSTGNWTRGSETWSPGQWKQIGGGGAACPGPSLNDPSDGYVSSSQTVNFSWSAPGGCTFEGYTFRIKDTSTMDSGGNTIVDTGNSLSSRTETIGSQWNNRDLYWGVRTANPLSPNWSVRRFRIEPGGGCNPTADQTALFMDINYGGTCVIKGTGEYPNPASLGIANDSVSSVKVGGNVQLILCRDDNYAGGCETFTGDDSNLSDNSIGDNSVSSAKVAIRTVLNSLSASPSLVSPGQNIQVSWSGLDVTGNDWISVHPADGPDSNYFTWQSISGSSGSATFNAPSSSGDINFRLFRNATKAGTSNIVTVKRSSFADVPIDHPFWAYIEAFYNAGITTGCGVSPLIYCPEQPVTRAAMAVFLLRAKYGSGYAPPAASHFFADLPVAGKEWMQPWVDELYREGITGGCGTGPLIYCPETSTTRAAMAVFILRTMYGSGYTPPTASHYFADLPVAGKEWMEPWVDELYREGITTGCGTGPLIYCPETAVKRQAMAAFIVRAFDLPMP